MEEAQQTEWWRDTVWEKEHQAEGDDLPAHWYAEVLAKDKKT